MEEAEELVGFRRGAIMKIAMRNFMYFGTPRDDTRHEFDLHPRINVLSGPNGSGKSSIVAAIGLCCGARPSFLLRGKFYKDLIKRGADDAEVELTLHDPQRPDGKTTFKLNLRKTDRYSPWKMFVNGDVVDAAEYRRYLKDMRIFPENLTQFLPQERVSDFAKMKPEKLLSATEEALGGEVYEMHQELSFHRREWIKKEEELKKLKDSMEEKNEQKGEYAAEQRKLRNRDEAAERCLVPRIKLLAMEIKELKDELALLDVEIGKCGTETGSLGPTLLSTYSDFLKYSREKPEFVNSPAIAADGLTSLNEFSLAVEKKLLEQSNMQAKVAKLGIQLAEVRAEDPEEIAFQTASEALNESIKELENELAKNGSPATINERMEVLKNNIKLLTQEVIRIETKRDELVETLQKCRDDEKRMLMQSCSATAGNLVKVEQLVAEKKIPRDIQTMWELVHNQTGVLGPLFLYIKPTRSHYLLFLENALGSSLSKFVCNSSDRMLQLRQELMQPNNLKVPLAGGTLHLDDKHTFPADFFPVCRRMGFSLTLEEMFEADDDVKLYLRGECATRNTLVGLTAGETESQNMIRWWRRQRYQMPFRFLTATKMYEFVGADKQVVKVADLRPPSGYITFDADAPQDDKARIQYDIQLRDVQARRKRTETDLQEAEAELASFNVALAKANEEDAGLDLLLEQAQETVQKLKEKQDKLLNISHVERNPTVPLADMTVRSLKEQNTMRFLGLCGSTSTLVKAATLSAIDAFDKATQGWSYLLGVSRSMDYLRTKKKKKDTLITQKDSLEKARQRLAERLEKNVTTLKDYVNELFVDRGKTAGDVQKMLAKFKGMSQPQLVNAVNEGFKAYRDLEKADFKKLERLHPIATEEYERDLKLVREMEFSLKVAQASQLFLREQWKQRLEDNLSVMDRYVQNMFEGFGNAGRIELAVPEDLNHFDKYGIKITLAFREGEERIALNSTYQSGGERVVGIAVYLLALQGISDVPFRIVDEINQGMDTRNEKNVFKLVLSTAKKHDAQYLFCSPKIVPNFKAEGGRISFCFLMKSLLTEDTFHASDYTIPALCENHEIVEE